MMPALYYHPAKTQITYMGYPNTTGATFVDYRIVDHFTDDTYTEQYNSEKLLYMPRCFLCFDVKNPVFPIPHKREKSYVCFGVLNRIHKINESLLSMIKQILDRVHDSKVVFKFKEEYALHISPQFFQMLDKDRVVFIEPFPSYRDYLEYYNEVDVCLDTFPYSGTTTTCESLMMDTPVITLYAEPRRHSQNVSASILINSQLKECVAKTREEYIQKAVFYATHPLSVRKAFIEANEEKQFSMDFEALLQF